VTSFELDRQGLSDLRIGVWGKGWRVSEGMVNPAHLAVR
jgi:hypothetical protein